MDVASIAAWATATIGNVFDATFEGALRRPHTLASGGAVRRRWRLKEPAAAGDTEITLEAAGASPMTGSAPRGLGLSVNGESAQVAEKVTAGVSSVSISLAAPLEAGAPSGSEVELSSFVESALPAGCVMAPIAAHLLAPAMQIYASATLTIPELGLESEPEHLDLVVDGKSEAIWQIKALPSRGGGVWVCQVGEGQS